MKHSPITAHIVIVYQQEGETSTAFLEDVLDRQRQILSCPHRQVVAKIAKWAREHDYDQCEIRCEQIPNGQSTETTIPHSCDPRRN